jgi:undecaprenol kinase
MKSFSYAFNGIFKVIKTERNVKIHLIASALVTCAGICFSITKTEWLVLILTMCFVIVLEMINTAVEYMADLVSPDYNENVKIIKDVSAGAVLLAAIASVIIGLVIFIPYVYNVIA